MPGSQHIDAPDFGTGAVVEGSPLLTVRKRENATMTHWGKKRPKELIGSPRLILSHICCCKMPIRMLVLMLYNIVDSSVYICTMYIH